MFSAEIHRDFKIGRDRVHLGLSIRAIPAARIPTVGGVTGARQGGGIGQLSECNGAPALLVVLTTTAPLLNVDRVLGDPASDMGVAIIPVPQVTVALEASERYLIRPLGRAILVQTGRTDLVRFQTTGAPVTGNKP